MRRLGQSADTDVVVSLVPHEKRADDAPVLAVVEQPKRIECDVCPKPAVYAALTTVTSDEVRTAKLCVSHGQLAHDYKPPRQVQVNDQKRLDFIKTSTKDKTLGAWVRKGYEAEGRRGVSR